MKNALLATTLMLVLTPSALAQPAGMPIRTCSTLLEMPGQPAVPTLVEIFAGPTGRSALVARVTQEVNGRSSSYEDVAQISRHGIRPGLSSRSTTETLNLGEALIVHAMTLTEDPVYNGAFNAGFDLKAARAAVVYQVGELTNMGATAIIEAYDAGKKPLGSFFGGFLVSPCR